MKKKNIILSLILIILLAACKNTNGGNVSQETSEGLIKYDAVIYEYFDTITKFVAYAKDEDDYNKYRDTLEESLKKYHQLFNTYYDFDGVNNVKTINDNAGVKPVEVDPAIIELLEYSKEMYEVTDGKINTAMGSLLGLWHEYREEALANPKDTSLAKIPTEEELKEAASHIDIEAIEIDKEKSTVYISDPDVQIDVGAIGKGYAIKKIVAELKEAGLSHGIISIGGDDVMVGENPAKEDGIWTIAIQNPDLSAEDPYSSVIGITDTTVVTSGDYQRFYKVDGKIYHHIIDPETMYPSQYFRSVSVVHEDIALADTLSTYFFLVDFETGLKLADEYGAEVLWIDHDDNHYMTDGWSAIEK